MRTIKNNPPGVTGEVLADTLLVEELGEIMTDVLVDGPAEVLTDVLGGSLVEVLG